MGDISPIQEQVLKELVGKKALAKAKGEKGENNVIYTSFLETPEYILEQVGNSELSEHGDLPGVGGYIVFDKESGTTTIEKEFFYNNLYHRPIVSELVGVKAIYLPSGVEEYGETSDLIAEIRKFINQYAELPNIFEKIIPYFILFYWVYDKFPFIPYLHFVGRTGTGKTTAMEVVGRICYKAIDAAGAITMASIFRTATQWRGTMLLDEFSGGGENYHEMIAFLKTGVSDRAILRVEGEREKTVKAFRVKSPKIFTSEDPISDAGLQSRTVVVRMEKNGRRIPLYRLNRYEKEAGVLRNKLLLWRLKNWGKINLDDIEFGYPDLSMFDSRVQQVLTPPFYFSDEATRQDIVGFAKVQEEETQRERREALPGQIFQIIMDQYPISLALSFIVNELNKTRKEKTEYTAKKIGGLVRKVLGFDTVRANQGYFVVMDGSEGKVNELCDYYGIPSPAGRSPSSPSSQKDQIGANYPSKPLVDQSSLTVNQSSLTEMGDSIAPNKEDTWTGPPELM